MSSIVVRVLELGNGAYQAKCSLDRIATSPELAVRMAAAAALGCELSEVTVTGQARDLYLACVRSGKSLQGGRS